jgi:2'-5' RNA ligase
MNMGRKAVDVVLLPDEVMTSKAIETNAGLIRKSGEEIVLNKRDCLPHISLAMGCMDDRDIAVAEEILRSVAGECNLGGLTILGVWVSENSAGEKVSAFEVEKTEELQLLHETIMESLGPYLSSDITADTIYGYDNDEVAETTLAWIKNYRQKASFGKFFPHITIGYGQVSSLPSFPIRFAASKLALCHLGNHCTCRSILAAFKL